MKLVVNINSIEQLNNLKDYASCVLIEDENFSNYRIASYDSIALLEEANRLNITPIIKLNSMIHPFKLEMFKNTLIKYLDYNCLFLFTDLGACHIASSLGIINRVIYDPITMITNSLDANLYSNYGFNAIGLSLEITIDDVKKIIEKTKAKIFYQIFGYHLMFHSKRPLISLYEKFENKTIIRENLTLEETTRTDRYPILESNNGTFIFRSYAVSLLDNLNDLDIEYALIDSFNLSTEAYNVVVKTYSEYLNKHISLYDAKNVINSLDIKIDDGFTYKDSDYKKEGLK